MVQVHGNCDMANLSRQEKQWDAARLKGAVILADNFFKIQLDVVMKKSKWCKWALNNNSWWITQETLGGSLCDVRHVCA